MCTTTAYRQLVAVGRRQIDALISHVRVIPRKVITANFIRVYDIQMINCHLFTMLNVVKCALTFIHTWSLVHMWVVLMLQRVCPLASYSHMQ